MASALREDGRLRQRLDSPRLRRGFIRHRARTGDTCGFDIRCIGDLARLAAAVIRDGDVPGRIQPQFSPHGHRRVQPGGRLFLPFSIPICFAYDEAID